MFLAIDFWNFFIHHFVT